MALNSRQKWLMSEVRALASTMESVRSKCFALSQSFDEEFTTGTDNDLSVPTTLVEGTPLPSLDVEYAVSMEDMVSFSNMGMKQFIGFYDGAAVTAREYGKFIRRVR